MMHVGFLGFGEAARAFQESLKAADPGVSFSAWDVLLADSATAPAMREEIAGRGVAEVAVDGLGEVDWVFSAVTADQSYVALDSVVPHLRAGQIVVDINSVSPDRKRQSAELVEAAGAMYLDMAVMGPVHPRGHATPVIVAGRCLAVACPVLRRLGFDFHEAGNEPGQATAIKMVRSLFVKGLEAITVETLLAAQASGCLEEILASLSKTYPGLVWPEFASYQFERTLRHGKRRAAEMRESAATVSALGLNGRLAEEIAAIHEVMGAIGEGAISSEKLTDLIGEVERKRGEATRF